MIGDTIRADDKITYVLLSQNFTNVFHYEISQIKKIFFKIYKNDICIFGKKKIF